MAKPDADQPLVASLFDRLLDDDPESKSEPQKGARQVVRELRGCVRRDLENLLNTRQHCLSWPKPMSELERSILAYGVPDLTGANLSNARAREEFLRSIESVIRSCEPRFKSVRVSGVESPDPLDRTLRFRIDALLYADPAPEAMTFDSHLEPVTRSFALKS